MNLYAVLAAGAVAILLLAEILITIQKSQMKKQFLEALDPQDKQTLPNSEDHDEDRTW